MKTYDPDASAMKSKSSTAPSTLPPPPPMQNQRTPYGEAQVATFNPSSGAPMTLFSATTYDHNSTDTLTSGALCGGLALLCCLC